MDGTVEFLIGQLARELGLWLATAESCTGGLIGHQITNVPGSSDYYRGGVVAYSNEAKQRLLGVRPETLDQYGAVSRETVLEMAKGVCLLFRAEVGLSVSGIAGPGGGSPEKPVGTVWIGLESAGEGHAWPFHFAGDRLAIKEQAGRKALELLSDHLRAAVVRA